MYRLISIATMAILGLGLIASNAQAGHRCRGGDTYYVAPAAATATTAAASAETVAAAPQPAAQGYRSMSYQPAPESIAPAPESIAPAPAFRGSRTGGQDKWMLQKTDPRKYR